MNEPERVRVKVAVGLLLKAGAGRIRPARSQPGPKRPVRASIAPVAYSKVRSPPSVAEPVRFALAATSDSVSAASVLTKLRPSGVPATEHP